MKMIVIIIDLSQQFLRMIKIIFIEIPSWLGDAKYQKLFGNCF